MSTMTATQLQWHTAEDTLAAAEQRKAEWMNLLRLFVNITRTAPLAFVLVAAVLYVSNTYTAGLDAWNNDHAPVVIHPLIDDCKTDCGRTGDTALLPLH